MIDYFLKFASEAAAKTALSKHLVEGEWPLDLCIPDIKIWRASQDTTSTDDDGNEVVTHNYLPGFFILVSLPNVVPALRDSAAVQIVINREKANARQAGAVIKSGVSNAMLQDIRISPTFAGSDMPYGNMK